MTLATIEQASASYGIISGTARCVNTKRSLTRLLDYTERGLAMKATQPCPTPSCPDPFVTDWRPVPGYEGIYALSSHGDVRRTGRRKGARAGRLLALKITRYGYKSVHLWCDNREKTRLVHVLVAKAFIGLPPTEKHEVNHKDGDKTNACWGNLEWVTRSENNEHAWRTGLRVVGDVARGERAGGVKLTEDQVREIRRLYVPHIYGTPRLAREFGVHQSTIYALVTGKSWSCVK